MTRASARRFDVSNRHRDRRQELILRAASDPNKLNELIEELQSGDEKNDQDWAWLLERWRREGRLPRPAHRPKRSVSDKTWALECAAYLVRIGKRDWCRRHGTRIATQDTPLVRLIDRAIALVASITPANATIDPDKVRDAQLLKPKTDIREHVREYLPEAVAAMSEID